MLGGMGVNNKRERKDREKGQSYLFEPFIKLGNLPAEFTRLSSTRDDSVADVAETDEDTVLNVAATGVLANDTDLDADPLSASVATDPLSGTLDLNSDGSFTYVPDADFSGSDTFTYQVSDGQAVSAPVTVLINVALVNVAPEAVDDAFEVVGAGDETGCDVVFFRDMLEQYLEQIGHGSEPGRPRFPLWRHRQFGFRHRRRARDGFENRRAGGAVGEALGERARPKERILGFRRLRGEFQNGVVADDAISRHVAALRLALAPGREFMEHRVEASVAVAALERLAILVRVQLAPRDAARNRRACYGRCHPP